MSLPGAAFELSHEGGERSADHFVSVALARLPTSREYIVRDAGHVGDLATLAHFGGRSRSLSAHDGGVDVGKEVGHDGLPFFVDHQIVHRAVAPRNIAVDADSESEDDFPGHAAIVMWMVSWPSRGKAGYMQLWKCPTQAKIGLEWATRRQKETGEPRGSPFEAPLSLGLRVELLVNRCAFEEVAGIGDVDQIERGAIWRYLDGEGPAATGAAREAGRAAAVGFQR